MKSVMIVTLWDSNNYGAYLQAFSLGNYCRKLGYNVSYLEDSKEDHKLKNQISKKLNKTVYQIKLARKFKKAKNVFKLVSHSFAVDYVLVGADEVWNVNNNYFQHLDYYLGYNLNSKKIISYAPSCNGTKKGEFLSVYSNKNFTNFNRISVRDNNTASLVYSIQGTNPKVVLDPTFLTDNYEEFIITPSINNYVFVYGYGFLKEEISEIKRFASDRNLKIISAGAFLDWTDEQICSSPFEFLGLIKHSEYVFTSTFHGTVFSIIFNKIFFSFARNNSKVLEILDLFDLNKRNLSNYYNGKELDNNIDYDKVNLILKNLRKESKQFLLDSFNND